MLMPGHSLGARTNSGTSRPRSHQSGCWYSAPCRLWSVSLSVCRSVNRSFYIKSRLFYNKTMGLLLIICGVVVQFGTVRFIEMYTEHLDDELEPQVCVEPRTGLDFCSRMGDLSKIYFGDWVLNLGSLLMIIGILVFLFSILGFVAACCKYKASLYLMIGLGCVCIMAESYANDILTNESSTFHVKAQEELVSLIQQEYELAEPSNDSFTQALNLIMLQGECCGIKGREDFGANLTFKGRDGFIYNFLYPPACTRRNLLQDKRFQAFARYSGCKDPADSHLFEIDINTEGCYKTVFKYISNVYGTKANRIFFYLIASHCVAIALAHAKMTPFQAYYTRLLSTLSGSFTSEELVESLETRYSLFKNELDHPNARYELSPAGSTIIW